MSNADAKELLGPPSAGSLCDVCGLSIEPQWTEDGYKRPHQDDPRHYRLGYEREKIRADAATKALLDYAERNATPKEAPSASLSEALTGKEGLEAPTREAPEPGGTLAERHPVTVALEVWRRHAEDGEEWAAIRRLEHAASWEPASEQPRAVPSASLPAGPKDLERAAAPRADPEDAP